MIKNFCILTILINGGQLTAQAEINFSLEGKYGKGNQVTGTGGYGDPVLSDYNFFENLLDVNANLTENIYIYSQLEYSDPPVFGTPKNKLSVFYLEYETENLNLKIGDLLELYGRGMSFYTYQDQNIDYDNSLQGLQLKYELRDNLSLSALMGKKDFHYRSNVTARETDSEFNNNTLLGALEYENDNFGTFQYLYLNNQSIIGPDLIWSISSITEIGGELDDRVEYDTELDSLFQAHSLYSAGFINTDIYDDTVITNNHNLNWNTYIGPFDIYLDKVWSQYSKLYGDETFGSRFYTSLYIELLGVGITYEYKNYNTPYLLKSISNPPIVYRLSTSVLAARNAHAMNFGNEVGHQVEINKSFENGYSMQGNISLARKHQKEDMANYGFLSFIGMNQDSAIFQYNPFRQVYAELNGWTTFYPDLYFKIGVDWFTEYLDKGNPEITDAVTIPTQWVLKLNSGNSITLYLEFQKQVWEKLEHSLKIFEEKTFDSKYLSIGYSKTGSWVFSLFYDVSDFDKKSIYGPDAIIYESLTTRSEGTNSWPGVDFTYYFSHETQLSLFYGSQKGGLICANGICAEQPGFEDGIKFTLRSIF